MADELGLVTPTPTPRSRAARYRAAGFDFLHEKFLEGEEGATARLRGFYEQGREEIEGFVRSGDTTASDVEYYSELLRQAEETLARLNAGANAWAADTFPPAYVAGAQTTGGSDFIFRPVHDQALRELSGYSLGLIRDTNEGIRRSIQQAVASAISSGITRAELNQRIIGSGLQPGPWKSVEIRAAVIARTETMRAYNGGNLAAIAETGAVAGEWHTAKDERTCPICAPLHGQAFILPGVSYDEAIDLGLPVHWQRLEPVGTKGNVLKVPPRHPRCRCTLRARYRLDDGTLIGTKPPDDAAMLEDAKDAMTGPPTDIDARIAALSTTDPVFAAQSAELAQATRDYDLARAENIRATNALMGAKRDPVTLPDGRVVEGQTIGPAAASWRTNDAMRELIERNNPDLLARVAAAQAEVDRLTQILNGLKSKTLGDPEIVDYWRSIDLDAATIAKITSTGTKKTANAEDLARVAAFMRYRYGIELQSRTGYTSRLLEGMIQAQEEYIALGARRYVINSPTFRIYSSDRATGRNVLGDYNRIGTRIRLNMSKLTTDYAAEGSLRGGPGVRGDVEIIAHEIAHSVDEWQRRNRTGYSSDDADWAGIRSATVRKIAPIVTLTPKEIADLTAKIDDYEGQIKKDPTLLRYYRGMLNSFRTKLADGQASAPPAGEDWLPTEYASRGGSGEDFAESVMLYLLNPEHLAKWSPRRYAFVRDRLFGGMEKTS